MAGKIAGPIPVFAPSFFAPSSSRSATEVRFSRWNNANAEPFIRRQREQKEIEDEIRRLRRFEIANLISEESKVAESAIPTPEFKSRGTPSSPSRSSIPGKSSKYSKPDGENPRNFKSSKRSHPAFRRSSDVVIVPLEAVEGRPEITVGENGVAYKLGNAPFEFQYSYTETPKAKPLALREPPYLPFGPSTMPRPWTGKAPLAPSKKNLPEFDSFRPPPPGKKGVKPVQSPGPFLSGSGPKYEAVSREELLGEPLSQEEVKDLIKGCLKTKRQLNIGRDGLTHNMLDNIHAHWKRRRVCKIKCKGVCTVDMDNVRQQLEDKTGGKVIFSRGGVIFLFRGRNYNYKNRPKYPLMLWKPIPPVYPRLVQRAPEGLTLEEATEMRKIGRSLSPICKLGKNGVYCNLVREVREAFEVCELIRINCQVLNKSDTRKIGAKLKDLVPCVLISFEHEHILMWRGRNWKSYLSSSPEDSMADLAEFLGEEILSELASKASSEEDDDGISDDDSISQEPEEDIDLSPSTSAAFDALWAMLNKAVDDGGAVVLEPDSLDPDLVKQRAAELARTSPPGPAFNFRPNKPQAQKPKKVKAPRRGPKEEDLSLALDDAEEEEMRFLEVEPKSRFGRRREQLRNSPSDVVPHGSLGVDELAKLLS
ncbi:RNA-binding CRS1 / YhbY (CRM) domain-containing protein [Wolffia australiana]